jgi:hypothetical protein
MNAKNRLALEQAVTRLARDLDAARELIQLLESAIWEPRIRLDLLELARETFKAGASTANGGPGSISATLSSIELGMELFVNPRVAMSLLSIGVQLAASGRPGVVPHIAIQRQPSGECGVAISSQGGPGEPIVLGARRIVPPTLSCAQAVASVSDARFEYAPEQGHVALVWAFTASESRA